MRVIEVGDRYRIVDNGAAVVVEWQGVDATGEKSWRKDENDQHGAAMTFAKHILKITPRPEMDF